MTNVDPNKLPDSYWEKVFWPRQGRFLIWQDRKRKVLLGIALALLILSIIAGGQIWIAIMDARI